MIEIFSSQLKGHLISEFEASKQARVAVRNDSDLMQSSHPDVQAVCKAARDLGVDLDAAETSADIARYQGRPVFYSPELGLSEGVLVLRWGKQDIGMLPMQVEADVNDSGALFWTVEGEAGVTYIVRARMLKGENGKPLPLAKVLAAVAKSNFTAVLGELGSGSGGGARLASANTLIPGQVYEVVGKGYREMKQIDGTTELQSYIELKDGQLITTSAYLKREFFTNDELIEPTPTQPATLHVYESVSEYQGNKVANLMALPFVDASSFEGLSGGFDSFESEVKAPAFAKAF
jgi:hypothetical protein